MNKQAAINIMNKRVLVSETLVGRTMQLSLQGDGNTVDVKNKAGVLVLSITEPEGTVFRKRIYNCKANSEIAMRNERNRQLWKEAIAAEKAGKADEAHDKFSAFLNAVQFSFNIPLPSSIVGKLSDKTDISGKVQKIDTDKGSLLTLDPSTVKALEPVIAGTTSFAGYDDIEEEDAVEEETGVTAEEALTA